MRPQQNVPPLGDSESGISEGRLWGGGTAKRSPALDIRERERIGCQDAKGVRRPHCALRMSVDTKDQRDEECISSCKSHGYVIST